MISQTCPWPDIGREWHSHYREPESRTFPGVFAFTLRIGPSQTSRTRPSPLSFTPAPETAVCTRTRAKLTAATAFTDRASPSSTGGRRRPNWVSSRRVTVQGQEHAGLAVAGFMIHARGLICPRPVGIEDNPSRICLIRIRCARAEAPAPPGTDAETGPLRLLVRLTLNPEC